MGIEARVPFAGDRTSDIAVTSSRRVENAGNVVPHTLRTVGSSVPSTPGEEEAPASKLKNRAWGRWYVSLFFRRAHGVSEHVLSVMMAARSGKTDASRVEKFCDGREICICVTVRMLIQPGVS